MKTEYTLQAFARPAPAKPAAPRLNPAAPASNSNPYEAIDAYVKGQMHRLNIPGVSLAIVEGDRIVHLRGFGKARPGGEAPSPRTPFFIGSLTKSFTALAVMQLVEAGKVELDAPVQRYLPWFRVADPQASAQMTVRHLLNQTSGLPVLAGETALAGFDQGPEAIERMVRAMSAVQVNRPVGTKCEYCNLNYDVLGLVIEVASGEKYADYIQTHIFNPLEMSHSYGSKAAAKKAGLAMGHRHWFSFPFPAPDVPIPSGSLASGQLISSTEDLAHYLIAHLNGGCFGDVQILSNSGIDDLQRGAAEFITLGVSMGRYAMGWVDDKIGPVRIVWHGGNVPDFSSFAALFPEQKKGLVLLFNADPYGIPPVIGEVGFGAAALLAGQQPASIRLDFIQWVMRLLPLVPLLQVSGVFATLRKLRNWRQDPSARPSSGRMWRKHILLPLVPNLALAAILAAMRSSGLLRYLHLYNPDLAWIVQISGRFAGIWALLRTGAIRRAFRENRS